GQLHVVENYWEAVGIMAAMKAGIAPKLRPAPHQTGSRRKIWKQTGGRPIILHEWCFRTRNS
ncbi:MAG: hypothetical protein CL895_08500, partial [Dehalococcoidia bacterium]|nr:hypothetical protein [Dehalococcoidia bacterium]